MFTQFFNNLYGTLSKIPFDALIWFIWGAYIAIFAAVFILTLCSNKFGTFPKRPFFHLTNAFTAVTFSAFLSELGIPQALAATVIFWTVGYLLYGALCALTRRSLNRKKEVIQSVVAPSGPSPPSKTAREEVRFNRQVKEQPEVRQQPPAPAAKNCVRLEHAIAVTDKLLMKNLAKGDRLELEKLKNTLAVLKLKGTMNPAEAEILNENFNALLKLMAKYNV